MDRYVVVRQIGKGSYGAALLARLKIDSSVLLVIKRVKLESSKEKASAQQEVRMLAQLTHPHVVGYVDSFFHQNYLCIVTEYCEGGDLYKRLKACTTHVPEPQVLDWLVQTARALAHLHAKRILHRDLKTQNIFLTKAGEVKLGDFGIARTLSAAQEMAVTIVGTPFYMSPELMASKPYSFKTDVWSLGCVLYEMTSLQHAFSANDMSGLVLKILRGAYEPTPECYSPELRELIRRLLSKDPDDRPDAEAILEEPFLAPRVAATAAAFEAAMAAHVRAMADARTLATIPPGGRSAAVRRASPPAPRISSAGPQAQAAPLAPAASAELQRIRERIAKDREDRRALEANIRQLECEAARLQHSGGGVGGGGGGGGAPQPSNLSPQRRAPSGGVSPAGRPPSPPSAASAAARVAAARKAYAAPPVKRPPAAPPPLVAAPPPHAIPPRDIRTAEPGARRSSAAAAAAAAAAAGGGAPIHAAIGEKQGLLDAIAGEREALRVAREQLDARARAAAAAAAAAASPPPAARERRPSVGGVPGLPPVAPRPPVSLAAAREAARAADGQAPSAAADDELADEEGDRLGNYGADGASPVAGRDRRSSTSDASSYADEGGPRQPRRSSRSSSGGGGSAALSAASQALRQKSLDAFLERRNRALGGAGPAAGAVVAGMGLSRLEDEVEALESALQARLRRRSEPGVRAAAPPPPRVAAAAAAAARAPPGSAAEAAAQQALAAAQAEAGRPAALQGNAALAALRARGAERQAAEAAKRADELAAAQDAYAAGGPAPIRRISSYGSAVPTPSAEPRIPVAPAASAPPAAAAAAVLPPPPVSALAALRRSVERGNASDGAVPGSGAAELLRLRDIHSSISRRMKAMRAVVREAETAQRQRDGSAAGDAPSGVGSLEPEEEEEEDDEEEEFNVGDDDTGGPVIGFDDSSPGADVAHATHEDGDVGAAARVDALAATLLQRDLFTEAGGPAGRAAALRGACESGLGATLFVRLYGQLRDHSKAALAAPPAETEAAFRRRVAEQLGRDKQHFLGLLDRLLFEEEQVFGPA